MICDDGVYRGGERTLSPKELAQIIFSKVEGVTKTPPQILIHRYSDNKYGIGLYTITDSGKTKRAATICSKEKAKLIKEELECLISHMMEEI